LPISISMGGYRRYWERNGPFASFQSSTAAIISDSRKPRERSDCAQCKRVFCQCSVRLVGSRRWTSSQRRYIDMVAREEVDCGRPLDSLFSERAKSSLEDMESGSEIVEM
jgi:hypothetical protein